MLRKVRGMRRRDFLGYAVVALGGLSVGCGTTDSSAGPSFFSPQPSNQTGPQATNLAATVIRGTFRFDNQGNRYEIDGAAGTVTRFSASGKSAWKYGTKGLGQRDLDTPVALAVDGNGLVWILDAGLGRLQVIDGDGQFLRNVGDFPSSQDVVIRGSRVFVSDSVGHKIFVLDLLGNSIAQWSNDLTFPRGLALDAAGRLHLADVSQIKVFSETGSLAATYGSFRHALGLAIRQSDGLIAVVDAVSRNIQLFSPALQSLGPVLVPLQPLDVEFGPDGQLYVGGLA